MKKVLGMFICVVTAVMPALAQQDTISNGSFERWHTPYNDPDNWYTLNALTDFGYEASTTKEATAHNGSFAVRLEGKAGTFSDIPGLISSGPILDGSGSPNFDSLKVPFHGQPKRLQFYYKSMPQNGDTCAARMVLTRWNPSFMRTDTVAVANFLQAQTVNVYTFADVEFVYLLPFTPDSAMYLFSSSLNGFSPVVGSVFIIDDVGLSYYNMGTKEPLPVNPNVRMYPVPASGVLNISTPAASQVSITDMSGREVLTGELHSGPNTLDIAALSPGLYAVSVRSEDKQLSRQKLLVR